MLQSTWNAKIIIHVEAPKDSFDEDEYHYVENADSACNTAQHKRASHIN